MTDYADLAAVGFFAAVYFAADLCALVFCRCVAAVAKLVYSSSGGGKT